MNWDLSKLYTGFDDSRLHEDTRAVREAIATLETLLSAPLDADRLTETVDRLDRALDLYGMVADYTQLTLAANASDEAANGYMDRVIELSIGLTGCMSRLSRALAAVEAPEALLEANDTLRLHAPVLQRLREDAAHTLPEALEPSLLRMQATGGRAWEKLRNDLDASHTVPVTRDGETEQLPLSAARNLAYAADRETRRIGYEAELAAYPKLELPMAACLNGIKGEAITLAELRGYPDVLTASLADQRTDRATLDAMLTAIRESLPMFRRYLRLKARLLGYEGGLKWYDLFAPVGECALSYTLDEARELLTTVMARFSPEMSAFMDNAFREHWIDVYPREGKQGGAFCESVHAKRMSYILSNFDGSYGAVSTFAHELGHAWHNTRLYDLPALLADYPMPLAETASTFNELLLLEKILETADERTRLTLLEQQLSDATQVCVDILSRFLFEQSAFAARADHAPSAKELCRMMTDAQLATYGDGLDPDCLHPYMWACKSHYYSPDVHFYNYPYAFGLLFGLGLFSLYGEKGEAFLADYDRLLSLTGTYDVRSCAAAVGIDVTDIEFWRSSLRQLEQRVDALEALVRD